MKRITTIVLLASGFVILARVVPGLRPPAGSLAAGQGATEIQNARRTQHVLTFEVAADCRTFVNGPNRADVSFGSGKMFPAGTLPSGTAINDPTQPVNGIAPIGDWTTRGQTAFPFPPEVAPAYASSPAFFATQYYIVTDRGALTVEAYAFPGLDAVGSVTGGTGGFRGTAGEVQGTPIGTNATGCPNFRATFHIEPGSARGAWRN